PRSLLRTTGSAGNDDGVTTTPRGDPVVEPVDRSVPTGPVVPGPTGCRAAAGAAADPDRGCRFRTAVPDASAGAAAWTAGCNRRRAPWPARSRCPGRAGRRTPAANRRAVPPPEPGTPVA